MPELNSMDFRIFKTYQYGIVNPLQVDEDVFAYKKLGVSLAPDILVDSAESLPYLVDFSRLPDDTRAGLLKQISQDAAQAIFCALLNTDVSQSRIVGHFKKQLVQRGADGKRALLRIYDARVVAHLRWILSSSQQDALLGPIQHWVYELNGRWHRLSREANTPAASWRPSQTQRAQLERVGLNNRVLAKAKTKEISDPHSHGADVDACLRRGIAHGLSSRQDLLAFALQALIRHAAFDSHPRIQSLLEQARAGKRPYYSASRALDEQAWQNIATELDIPEPARYARG